MVVVQRPRRKAVLVKHMPDNLVLCCFVACYVHSTDPKLPALLNIEYDVGNVARAALHKFRALCYLRIDIAVLTIEFQNILGV